ncbi:MAG: hypothetical protein WC879_05775 [Melioribacteraceae bacterium]
MLLVKNILENEENDFFILEEKIWPNELQATLEQLKYRRSIFPEGTFGIRYNDEPVGYAFSQIVSFEYNCSISQLEEYLPLKGKLSSCHNPKGNALHLMAGGIVPTFRNCGLWDLLISTRFSIAKKLGLKFLLIDTRMPFYSKYYEEHGSILPVDYAYLRLHGNYVDPLINHLAKLGFNILSPTRSSYIDYESGNCWIYMVKQIK